MAVGPNHTWVCRAALTQRSWNERLVEHRPGRANVRAGDTDGFSHRKPERGNASGLSFSIGICGGSAPASGARPTQRPRRRNPASLWFHSASLLQCS
jgi:hypothetical protein